ncbi:MAG: DUF2786 domain-containing protein [Ramlibacter sp.]|nr:DUF2786 domain-containing protein [Ramlibacter sp.]
MNRDDAIKKIKKCLALSRSAEPHEAAAAMRQAQKLMQEFRVDDHELSMIDVREVSVRAASMAPNVWDVMLAAIVSDAFGCTHFASISGAYNDAGNYVRKREYVFIGVDAAADVAAYAYQVLGRQCSRSRLAHIQKQPKNCKPITKTARGDAFANGWVYGVRELVERFACGDQDKALLLAYKTAKHPDLKTSKTKNNAGKVKDSGHVLAGIKAGESAQLNRGVSGIPERELLA